MIGLAFELIEWSVKLMIIAMVLMVRLSIWMLKALVVVLAAISVFVAAKLRERERGRPA
jgi:hypothetical protein